MAKSYTPRDVKWFATICRKSAKHSLEADLLDFELGQFIFKEVLRGRERGVRNDNQLLSFQQDLKKVGVERSIPTLHSYKHLFLGAHAPESLKILKLSRKYFIKIGEICDDHSIGALSLAGALRGQPFRDDQGDLDYEMLGQVGELAKPMLANLPWNPTGGELIERHLLEEREERLLAVHLRKDSGYDHDAINDTIGQMSELTKAIDACTQKSFLWFCLTSKGDPWEWIVQHYYLALIYGGGFRSPKSSSSQERSRFSTPKGYQREKQWEKDIDQTLKLATPEDMRKAEERVFLGKAQRSLLDEKKFPPNSIDVVLTDPPYGENQYAEWRPHLKVQHDTPKTDEEAAQLVAHVAKVFLERRLNKDRFVWLQFMPLKAVHVFVPPLLKVFEQHFGNEYRYQLLIWDKLITPKVGGNKLFVPRLEGIAYLNVNRPLAKAGKGTREFTMHHPLLEARPDKGEDGLFWKPLSILLDLIWLTTYGGKNDAIARQQVVLDPFAGAGSTGVAAIQSRRDFRLIESNSEQYKKALTQVLKAQKGQEP